MAPAPIFASFLILDKLLEEKKQQVETKPHGCVDMTHIRAHGAEKLTAAQLAMQNGLNELLENLTEEEIREELVSFAEEDPLTTTALLRLTNSQMGIAEEFHNLRWEQMLDFALLDKCAEQTTVINPQAYAYDDSIKRDTVRVKKQRGTKGSTMSAMSVVGTARGLALGSKESLMSVNSDNYNCLDEDGNLKQYVPTCYIWAGYLPPGKNTVYIYDRLNEQILSKEVVIELFPTGESCGVPAEIEFPSKPDPV